MKNRLRFFMGYAIGMGFTIAGARRHAIKRYDNPKTVLSVMTHHPTRKAFEDIINWLLDEHFHFVSTDELIDNKIVDLHNQYGRLAWLTLDDCWASCSSNVLPVIIKHGIPVTFFVPTAEIKRGILWRHSVFNKIDDITMERLHWMLAPERYDKIDRILSSGSNERVLMSVDEISEYAKNPLITFENHTAYHESCVHWPLQAVLDSIADADRDIIAWTGRKPRLVCYPYGYYSDLLDRRIRDVTGKFTVSCNPGVMTDERLFFVRNQIYDSMSFAENSCRVAGSWLRIKSQKKEQFVV